MKTIGIVLLLISFAVSMYYKRRSSFFLKEEFKNGFLNNFSLYPGSLRDEVYTKKEGIKYRDLSIIIFLIGLVLSILLIILGVS